MKLGKCCSIKHGYAFKGTSITNEPGQYVLVTPGNFRIGGGFKFADKQKFYVGDVPEEFVLTPGDLIVTMTDLSRNVDTLGFSAIVPEDSFTYLHNQRIGLVTVDESLVDKRFLYWLLRTRQYQRTIAVRATGSTVKHTSPTRILEYDYDFPEMASQVAIASLLDSIEEIISLNMSTNDYLAEMCEILAAAIESDDESVLADIAMQVTEKTGCSESSFDSYVSTESLLPDKGGRQQASSLPTTGKVVVYQAGDTLVSNIRPYFKKIWFADRDGACSGDVIVFRAKDSSHASFLYSVLRSDSFFEHVMAGAKGTKMPRGDKKQMMQYPIPSEPSQDTLDALTAMVRQISANNRENERLSGLRDALLPKLMSGEIDTSTIEMPTQPK